MYIILLMVLILEMTFSLGLGGHPCRLFCFCWRHLLIASFSKLELRRSSTYQAFQQFSNGYSASGWGAIPKNAGDHHNKLLLTESNADLHSFAYTSRTKGNAFSIKEETQPCPTRWKTLLASTLAPNSGLLSSCSTAESRNSFTLSCELSRNSHP